MAFVASRCGPPKSKQGAVKKLFPLLAGFAVAACAAGPDYRAAAPAALGVPEAWTGAASGPVSEAALAEWWRAYNDPVLDDFVARAVASNLDIAQAASRL